MVSLSLYNPLETKFTIKRPVFILISKIVYCLILQFLRNPQWMAKIQIIKIVGYRLLPRAKTVSNTTLSQSVLKVLRFQLSNASLTYIQPFLRISTKCEKHYTSLILYLFTTFRGVRSHEAEGANAPPVSKQVGHMPHL